MKVVSIVGLAGAGKSEVARVFEEKGFIKIRFGDLTDRELRARGLEASEENERYVRELLRKQHGMAAYAKLNLPMIDAALKRGNVVIDGLYSWEEYNLLKGCYGEDFYVVSVLASPKTRYDRLVKRGHRGLTPEEAHHRDIAEIENLNKAGPIVMADFMILNESALSDLRKATERVIEAINGQAQQTIP